jgi:arylsulfatase A
MAAVSTRLWQQVLVVAVGLALLSTLALAQSQQAPLAQNKERPPNIVLILADDAGVETVGAYGGSYHTPRLDELANEGVRFDNAHSTPLCTPSRVRLLTGRYSFRNYKAFGHLGPGEPTIAKVLRGAGYRTAVAGKWQLAGNPLDGVPGSTPQVAGFDEWRVWAAGPQFWDDGCQHWSPTLETNGKREDYPGSFGSDLVHDFALDFMHRNRARPFFLYYSMILPHDPWVATPVRRGVETRQDKFAAMMEYLDRLVGDVVAHLRRDGIDRQTLVVFLADNGTHPQIRSRRAGVEVQGGKGTTLDAGTHVPLILWWPGALSGEAVDARMVDLTDVFATVLGAAGQRDAAAASDGHDLLAHPAGGARWPRDAIFMDYALGWWPLDPTRYAFDARWKLYADGRFFDVAQDPTEQSAVPDTDEGGAGADRRAFLQRLLASMGDQPLTLADPHFPRGFDPEKIDYAAVTQRLLQQNQECGDPARAALSKP